MALPFKTAQRLEAMVKMGVLCLGLGQAGCNVAVVQPRQPQPPLSVSVSLSPSVASVLVLRTQTFTAIVQNDAGNSGVTWTLIQAGNPCSPQCGTLASSGANQEIYTAPTSVPNSAIVTLTATSLADATKSASATLTLIVPPPPPILVSLSPTLVSVQVLQTQQFAAVIENDAQNGGIVWTLTQSSNSCDPGCGALSAPAVNPVTYTAPSSIPNPATVSLTATSVTDNTKSSTATIMVIPSPVPTATLKFCDDVDPNCLAKDTFDLNQIRDLFIWVDWRGVPIGTHTQTIDLFLPQGHFLYISYSDDFAITDSSNGSATVLRPMPVAGTWITQRQLSGTWEVRVSLDGQLMETKTFQLFVQAAPTAKLNPIRTPNRPAWRNSYQFRQKEAGRGLRVLQRARKCSKSSYLWA
ncbi:MAG TPA: hypothetical protein VOA41_01260 [Candidatus Dormibacteraeota bacterium]|nr:hypothetical protein [Candidatus Dormibacteraeota bacterium]